MGTGRACWLAEAKAPTKVATLLGQDHSEICRAKKKNNVDQIFRLNTARRDVSLFLKFEQTDAMCTLIDA